MYYEYLDAAMAFLRVEDPYILFLVVCVLGLLTVLWRRRSRALAEAAESHRIKSHLDWTAPKPRRRR